MIKVKAQGGKCIPHISKEEYVFIHNLTDNDVEIDFQLGEKYSFIIILKPRKEGETDE